MHRFATFAVALAALAAAPSAAVAARDDASTVRRGLANAVAHGRVAPETVSWCDEILSRVPFTRARLPRARATSLRGVLADVAAQSRRYDEPRARALCAMLELNLRRLGERELPRDVVDDEGVVHRHFARHGYQFHPLAAFGRLNAVAVAGDREQTARLGAALLARGVRDGHALVWEYYFPFGGVPPWTSGFANAVAAQAFARAAALVGEPAFAEAATRAWLGARELALQDSRVGTWIRLYGFSDMAVLNAQLQTALSLAEYAELVQDHAALEFATQLRAAAAAALPLFDTGYWSDYALGGREASLHYHRYVVSLLRRLAQRTGEVHWAEAADRFHRYTREPPVVSVARAQATRRKRAVRVAVSLWVSKRSTVTLEVGGHRHVKPLDGGNHTVTWTLPRRPAPRYAFRVRAVDLAGNSTSNGLPPLVLRR